MGYSKQMKQLSYIETFAVALLRAGHEATQETTALLTLLTLRPRQDRRVAAGL
jgi:hypothetical protein